MSRLVESCESRTLLSISLNSFGELHIVGTDGPDVVEVTGLIAQGATPRTITAKMNAETMVVDSAKVKFVWISTYNGNDKITKRVRGDANPAVGIRGAIYGGSHNDEIRVEDDGNDYIDGFQGNDRIFSTAYNASNDTVDGGSGSDELRVISLGSLNKVAFNGQEDRDVVVLENQNSHVDYTGGTGDDELTFLWSAAANLNITMDGVTNDGYQGKDNVRADVELFGSLGNGLSITGTDAANRIIAFSDNVLINARGGNDFIEAAGKKLTINSGDGNDTIKTRYLGPGTVFNLNGGTGDDVIEVNSGNATVIGGDGNDSITTAAGVDSVSGGNGNDTVSTGTGNDTVYGGAGNDSIRTGDGADSIFGEDGNDSMDGGNGPDLIDGGGWGADLVDYSMRNFSVYVHTNDGKANDGGGEGDFVKPNVEVIVGGNGGDTLIGSDVDNVLIGNGGNDKLYGGKGNDRLIGGLGNNQLYGEDGNDIFFARFGSQDTIDGGAGIDSSQHDSGLDKLFNVENYI